MRMFVLAATIVGLASLPAFAGSPNNNVVLPDMSRPYQPPVEYKPNPQPAIDNSNMNGGPDEACRSTPGYHYVDGKCVRNGY